MVVAVILSYCAAKEHTHIHCSIILQLLVAMAKENVFKYFTCQLQCIEFYLPYQNDDEKKLCHCIGDCQIIRRNYLVTRCQFSACQE